MTDVTFLVLDLPLTRAVVARMKLPNSSLSYNVMITKKSVIVMQKLTMIYHHDIHTGPFLLDYYSMTLKDAMGTICFVDNRGSLFT